MPALRTTSFNAFNSYKSDIPHLKLENCLFFDMPCYQWLMRLHDLSQWVAATADEARFCRETPIDGLYRSWLTPNRSHQRAIAALLRILYPRYSKNPGHGCGMSDKYTYNTN